ncbi:MAG: HU family DNA-binding protein [Tannerella sp.]|jgi:predicted histone-like DNA-binding protein|nr:HU family DNA-binding protein [Tannerella sp.]
MSICYQMMEQTDNLHPEGNKKRGFYPRIISRGTVNVRELCQSAARGTTINAFEMEIVIGLMVTQILQELEAGNNVCIEEFGTFSVSAEATRAVHAENEIRAESIRVKRIVFKTSKVVMKRLKGFTFQKMPAK